MESENKNQQTNNIQNLLLGILSLAVIILYILHFTSKTPVVADANEEDEIVENVAENDTTLLTDAQPEAETAAEEATTEETQVAKSSIIAYVNVDTLLTKYELAKKMNADLLKKQKAAQAQLEAKANQLKTDYANVQQRYQKGLLTEVDAQMEGEKLNKQQQEMQELDAKLTKQMLDEQQNMNKQLLDKIQKFFRQYNKDKKYIAIFSNVGNDNILYAESYLNITNDVVKKLNEEYRKKK